MGEDERQIADHSRILQTIQSLMTINYCTIRDNKLFNRQECLFLSCYLFVIFLYSYSFINGVFVIMIVTSELQFIKKI
jgi:hypothetical protein